MKRSLIAAIAAAAGMGFASGPANAADEKGFLIDDTRDLASLCATRPGQPNYVAAIHMCQGYILGVHHFHTALAQAQGEAIYCVDNRKPRPSRNEVVDEFVVWVGNTPDVGDEEALDGVLRWAKSAFPCK